MKKVSRADHWTKKNLTTQQVQCVLSVFRSYKLPSVFYDSIQKEAEADRTGFL